MKPIIKHNLSEGVLPQQGQVKVGELVIHYKESRSLLYVKNELGTLVPIGEGKERFRDLEDVDIGNIDNGLLEEGYVVYRAGKFSVEGTIGRLSSLEDVEIANPTSGQYLRFDPLTESYINYAATYSLSEITDVEIGDISDEEYALSISGKVLEYDHQVGKFVPKERRNLVNQLLDVEIVNGEYSQILGLGEDGLWKNIDLQLEKDLEPKLGFDLNGNNHGVFNLGYKVNTLVCNAPIKELDYRLGDYWVIEGVPSSVQAQCVVNLKIEPKVNTTAICMLEIKQDSGLIILAGLQNIEYEDGKVIQLSGNGSVDLVTVLVRAYLVDNVVTYTSYITMNALNLAPQGLGGIPSFRYDKNRYPESQLFAVPSLYDKYFDYVRLLLTFEPEVSSGKTWIEDKSAYYNTSTDSYFSNVISSNVVNEAIDIYTFGIQERIAKFSNSGFIQSDKPISSSFVLSTDFTLEFYLSFENEDQYRKNTNLEYKFGSNLDDSFYFSYKGLIVENNTNSLALQTTLLEVKIGTNTYRYSNAYFYFDKQEGSWIHLSVNRAGEDILVFVNGVYVAPVSDVKDIGVTDIDLSRVRIELEGSLNSYRITDGVCRYKTNYEIPAKRFGLLAGYRSTLENVIYDKAYLIGGMEYEFDDYVANQVFY